jgi:hypothetical protein
MEYLGFRYRPYYEEEDDNCKIFHECYKDGQRITMPREFYNHSPYERMDMAMFSHYVQQLEVFIQG